MAAPFHAGCKRTLALALHDPADAAQEWANAAANPSPVAGALVPFLPPSEPIINAVPLCAVAPRLAPEDRAEPPWIRKELLRYLKFRLDLPVKFIAEKSVTVTDLDRHQNRFRLPSEGVTRNLRPMLSDLERKAASLLDEDAPRPPRLPLPPAVPAGPGEKAVRRKRKGKKHGGLPVLVVGLYTGIRELQLSTWESSRGTVIKGEGYLGFINDSGFRVGDVVEIWAFKETAFRLWGVDLCHDSPLYVLIAKKGQMLPRSNTPS